MLDYRNADGTVDPTKLEAAIAEARALPEDERGPWLAKFEAIKASQTAARGHVDVAQASGSTTIDVFGAIGESWFEEGFTARQVARVLAETKGPITLRINSGGGDAFEGAAIHALLTQAPNRVDVEILALAASSASIIAMSASNGGEIRMAETGVLMIHEASGVAMGGAEELESTARLLRRVNSNSADVYARRSRRTAAEMADLMSKETWFTAQEAVDMGLADRMVPGGRATQAAPADLTRAPESVRALLAVGQRATGSPMKTLAERLGLPADATEAQIMQALDVALAPKPTLAPISTSAPALVAPEPVAQAAQLAREATQSPEMLAELHLASATAAVERFISEGKIHPAQRAKAIAACGTAPAQLNAAVSYWESCSSVLPKPVQVQRDNSGKFTSEPTPAGQLTPTSMSPLQKRMCKEANIKPEDFCASKNDSSERSARFARRA